VQQALYRQSLRLEEHDDPDHPVVRLATQRIEELSGQAEAIKATIAELEAAQPEEPRPEEIEALLAGIPDLREALTQADGEELIELLDAFDVAVSYDKPGGALELSALLASDFVSSANAGRPPGRRSQNSSIAGGIRTRDPRVYEREPAALLDYVGRGLERFSQNRVRLRSAGIGGASCPHFLPQSHRGSLP
jgi:hypothetical protein